MDARQRKRNIKNSRKQEAQAAEDIGGRVQTNSGALRLGGGGDVRLRGKVRIECKLTEKEYYTLKLKELLKLKKQSIETLEYPVFQFAFKRNTGALQKLAVVPCPRARPVSSTKGELEILQPTSGQITIKRSDLEETLNLRKYIELHFYEIIKKDGGMVLRVLRPFEIITWDTFLERWVTQNKETDVRD